MRKKLSFLRSMRFGMTLLVIILIFCFAGSMIVQNRSSDEYYARYGESGAQFILALALDHVFTAPYFIIAALALCINLTDCSVSRFRNTLGVSRSFEERCIKAPISHKLSPEELERLSLLLKKKGFRRSEGPERVMYTKNRSGFWGSFCTHLSLLLVLIVGSAAIYTAEITDINIRPGTSGTLGDGTEIYVEDFRTSDESGRTDYVSTVNVTLPDGSQSGLHPIRVNSPLRAGRYKIYQQSFNTAGSFEITNTVNGVSSSYTPEPGDFFSLDGQTGYLFEQMYLGYERGELGEMRFVDDESLNSSSPVYVGYTIDSDGMHNSLLFPGDELTAGGISIKAGNSVTSAGLRVKALPGITLAALYFVFGFMVLALWLCFFNFPVCVSMGTGGFALISTKPQTGLQLELEADGFITDETN